MNTLKFYLKWVVYASIVFFSIILFFSWPITRDRLLGIMMFSVLLSVGSGITIAFYRKIYYIMKKD